VPGYILAHVYIHDPEEYRKYLDGFMKAFNPFKGKILVATDEVDVLEGEWPQARTIVMEFPSRDMAMAWYQSDDYRKLSEHRIQAAKTNMVLLEGYTRR
jgi:uncharacterized protein (DUF1330 family)